MIRETSLTAYRDIEASLGMRQQTVYKAIKYLGCPTNLEISRFKKIPINQVTPRVFELREKGVVVECEKRECSVSGRVVLSWRIR